MAEFVPNLLCLSGKRCCSRFSELVLPTTLRADEPPLFVLRPSLCVTTV